VATTVLRFNGGQTSANPLRSTRALLRRTLQALGCLLYELCALAPPFDAPNHLALAGALRVV
jgi:hypothetical protein